MFAHRAWVIAVVSAVLCLALSADSDWSTAAERTHSGGAKSTARSGEIPAGRRIVTTASGAFASERFLRTFRSNRDELKFQALHEVEALHPDEPALADALWQALEPLREGKKPTPSLLAAARLYAKLPAAAHVERQISLLKLSEGSVVLAAAAGLASQHVPEALPELIALRKHPEYAQRYAFRQGIVAAVSQYAESTAVEALLEIVSTSEGQLKYEAARQLARLTGENFGSKVAAWRAWWADRQAQGAAALTPAAKAPTDIPWDEPVPKFFNVPIYARRVVFVIDRSKSMESSVDTVTRLDEAQRELERTVLNLSESTHFDVLAYDTVLRNWRNTLVPATLQNKSDSLRFIYSLYPSRKTACYEALESALSMDPNLELIVFLSDGEPNAGRVVSPAQILQMISARNANGRVTIDVLGLDAQGPTESFLKQLAESNFGTYRPIR